jgi:hypothetical protein
MSNAGVLTCQFAESPRHTVRNHENGRKIPVDLWVARVVYKHHSGCRGPNPLWRHGVEVGRSPGQRILPRSTGRAKGDGT